MFKVGYLLTVFLPPSLSLDSYVPSEAGPQPKTSNKMRLYIKSIIKFTFLNSSLPCLRFVYPSHFLLFQIILKTAYSSYPLFCTHYPQFQSAQESLMASGYSAWHQSFSIIWSWSTYLKSLPITCHINLHFI